MTRLNISFAGAGRVTGALCREFYSTGHNIGLIVSETEKNGRRLAGECKSSWSDKLIFPSNTDIIIVAVPDNRIEKVLAGIKCDEGTLIVHTAGSISIEVFPEKIKRTAVFYPLQTFTVGRKVIFRDLPFFIESSDKESVTILEMLVDSVGGRVYHADSEKRRMIHLAAVFTCNFSNHMLTVGKELISETGFPFEVMKPLITETLSKAMDMGPENSQTGPAVRNDQNVIEKHLELLSFSPELKRIYSEMTRSIFGYYKDKR
jgi:predicted short-subunit dehydrogenase-like oxidoreductase (DUF2520 family)